VSQVLSVLAESLFALNFGGHSVGGDGRRQMDSGEYASSLGGEPLLGQYLRQPRLPRVDRLFVVAF
jgi:hypothetical protein